MIFFCFMMFGSFHFRNTQFTTLPECFYTFFSEGQIFIKLDPKNWGYPTFSWIDSDFVPFPKVL